MHPGFLEFVGLARHERDTRPQLAQRLGDLQPEPARAAGDERRPAADIEKLLHAHRDLPALKASAPSHTSSQSRRT